MKKLPVTTGLVMAGAVLVVVGAGTWWGVSANKGSIQNQPPKAAANTAAFKQYNGQYMQFRYSSEYFPKTEVPSDNDLALVMFTADTTYQKQLAVSVWRLVGGNLENNSAYKLRSVDTGNYGSKTVSVAGAPAQEFYRRDGSEITVFIPKDNMVGILSFSSNGGLDNLQAEVDGVLASYNWKQS